MLCGCVVGVVNIDRQSMAGNKLGDIVFLQAQISLYFQLREKFKAIFPMYFTYFFICGNITQNGFPSIYRGRTVSIQPYFINIYTIYRQK